MQNSIPAYNTSNINRSNLLIDNLIADYAKLKVIRVDFGIRKKYSNQISY